MLTLTLILELPRAPKGAEYRHGQSRASGYGPIHRQLAKQQQHRDFDHQDRQPRIYAILLRQVLQIARKQQLPQGAENFRSGLRPP